jgi:hypothetical protein
VFERDIPAVAGDLTSAAQATAGAPPARSVKFAARPVLGLARALGYADQVSNTVVDAIGDISGGVRLYNQDGLAS